MKFGLIDGQRVEPQPKLKALCPNCGQDLIAKCGRVKVWHWAHKGRKHCDQWWENETDWHRDWKNQFPVDWQERVHFDSATGEKHIADVKTPHGLVIEIQHSTIDTTEVQCREEFYKNMIWIIDGNRGELDSSYFNMGRGGPIQNDPLAYAIQWFGRGRLLHNWSQVSKDVYLDFGEDVIWRLILFDTQTKQGAVGPIKKSTFIEDLISGAPIRLLATSDNSKKN
ncbi:MAG: hypothetical protein GW808_02035 [Sphingomonadales bacterium]|nr:hypothetical protein [Sphingomonadales bacterium]NCO47929.1 hypothetical protein [Sphingomonadales bacterium]NCO99186.1 hypothetical protein [Sphingomonadales bacterium]NCP27591.1 hypothetical protein [Sphingomonadales bacterium]NCP42251.1 hypothetical protein [Sphingomonadales bacterium]